MKDETSIKIDQIRSHPRDPLHGKTLKYIVEFLHAKYGFIELGKMIKIKSFIENPSISSSLTFLRKTDWARKAVEDLYVATVDTWDNSEVR
jgi:uncharacterized protein (DUF2132 family)